MHIQIIQHQTIPSTNTWAKEHAHAFNTDALTIITANEQTAGRGRYNRQWLSPPDVNLYASFCFFTPTSTYSLLNATQLLPAAACLVLQSLNIVPTIKWPNDILVAQKKIAGILTETTPAQNQLLLILGIGLNVNIPTTTLAQINQPTTSLAAETGQQLDPADFVPLIAEKLLYLRGKGETFVSEVYGRFVPLKAR